MVLAFQQGPDIYRVTYYEKGAVPRQGDDMPSFTEVADAWERLTGENIRDGDPRWIGRFTDTSRQASEYRRGRVLLAGDAAHIHLPIGGQGMSAGVQDAVNLGWKLAAEVNGNAPAGLLDSYHSERHPVGARVLINTLTQSALYLSGEEMQPMRDLFAELTASEDVRRHFIGMVTGLDIVYEVGPGDHPLLGRRLPDRELITLRDEGKTTTFELLHRARGLLIDLTTSTEVGTAAAPWADRVDLVGARAHEDRENDPFAGACALLVRPDGYLAWAGVAGEGPQSLTDALTRWFGEPAGAAPGTEA
ncbi:FAD-dependent monooxygenase [Streptomyces sp. M10(2022)]